LTTNCQRKVSIQIDMIQKNQMSSLVRINVGYDDRKKITCCLFHILFLSLVYLFSSTCPTKKNEILKNEKYFQARNSNRYEKVE